MRIEDGPLTEPVGFFICHYIHCETMFFLFILVCIDHTTIISSKKTKGNRCDLKNTNNNKVNNKFFLSIPKVYASLICSGGICPGGKYPEGKCLGGIMSLG